MPLLIRLLATALLLASLASPVAASTVAASPSMDPHGLLLAWQRDPTTTMTIDWHVDASDSDTRVAWRPAAGEAQWQLANGSRLPIPASDRFIHRVELRGLQPDTEYLFKLGPYARERRFRTMPVENISRPVRIAIGGDVRGNAVSRQLSRQVMELDPDFVVWGGDLAYANGDERNVGRWHELLDVLMQEMVTDDGRSVPVLMGIGNHEVRGGYYDSNDHALRQGMPAYTQDAASRERIAPYYYRFAAFPGQPGYGALDFGNYLGLLLLDTDHSNPISGTQTRWLEQAMASRVGRLSHVLPVYHVGAYPSVRHWDGPVHQRVRQYWSPLFEKYQLPLVFEQHDHTYKRSWPIRAGRIDSRGVVYLGDGAWGVGVREVGERHEGNRAWYLDRVANQSHAIVLTLQGPHQHVQVINAHGQLIDEYPRVRPQAAQPADAVRWTAPAAGH